MLRICARRTDGCVVSKPVRQAGLPANDEFAARTQEGVGWYQVTQKKTVSAGVLRAAIYASSKSIQPARRKGEMASQVVLETRARWVFDL